MLNLLGLGTVARAGSVWDGMRRRGTAPDGIGRHRTSSRLTVEAVFKLSVRQSHFSDLSTSSAFW